MKTYRGFSDNFDGKGGPFSPVLCTPAFCIRQPRVEGHAPNDDQNHGCFGHRWGEGSRGSVSLHTSGLTSGSVMSPPGASDFRVSKVKPNLPLWWCISPISVRWKSHTLQKWRYTTVSHTFPRLLWLTEGILCVKQRMISFKFVVHGQYPAKVSIVPGLLSQ